MLRTSPSVPFADVASACRYADHAHMTREFTELAGCTPGELVGESVPIMLIVGPEGGPVSRERFLAVVESGELSHSDMSFEMLEARTYGDVALVLAHGTNHGSWQGTPFAADEWVTEVFVRRSQGWRCSFSALTPNFAAIAPPRRDTATL